MSKLNSHHIKAFFGSIGLLNKGENLACMKWTDAVGRSGVAKVAVEYFVSGEYVHAPKCNLVEYILCQNASTSTEWSEYSEAVYDPACEDPNYDDSIYYDDWVDDNKDALF